FALGILALVMVDDTAGKVGRSMQLCPAQDNLRIVFRMSYSVVTGLGAPRHQRDRDYADGGRRKDDELASGATAEIPERAGYGERHRQQCNALAAKRQTAVLLPVAQRRTEKPMPQQPCMSARRSPHETAGSQQDKGRGR